MPLETAGKALPVDDEGYLVDPADWSREVAVELARREGVVLTDEHWAVIGFMREYYELHRIAPDARFVLKHLADTRGPSETSCSGCFPMVTSSRPARSPACAGPVHGAPVERMTPKEPS